MKEIGEEEAKWTKCQICPRANEEDVRRWGVRRSLSQRPMSREGQVFGTKISKSAPCSRVWQWVSKSNNRISFSGAVDSPFTHAHTHAHTLSCRSVLYQQGEKAFLIFPKPYISSNIIRVHLPKNQKIYLSIILNNLPRLCHMSYGNFSYPFPL